MQSVNSILIFSLDIKAKEDLEIYLKSLGAELLAAYGFNDLIKKAAEDLVDLIIIDVGSLGANGFEAIRRLKADRQTGSIPVLLMTGEESDRAKAIEAGCADVVFKPLDKNQIQAKVETALNLGFNQFILDEKTKLETVLEAIEDGIVVVGRRSNIEELNAKARQLLSESNPAAGKNFMDCFLRLFQSPSGILFEKDFYQKNLEFDAVPTGAKPSSSKTLRVRTKIVKNIFSVPAAVVVFLNEK